MARRPFDLWLAAVSGILFTLSFPTYGHPVFGWIALAPLLVALRRGPLGRAFFLGLLTGVVYFVGTVYWITRVMVIYGGLNFFVAVLINAALIAYLALFPAVFALIVRRLTMAYGSRALMAAPFVWVATELGRTHVFGGFPWVLLGYSQVSVAPIAQFASVTGVYGVSALTAAAGSVLAVLTPVKRGGGAKWPYVWAATVLACLVVVAVWGHARIARGELTRDGQRVKVGLIQGNVDQAEKWNEARASAIFADYLRMTEQAIKRGAEIVLWPESSTPFFFEENRPGSDQIRLLASRAKVPILVGSDQIERGAPTRYYNSAFLVRADGSTAGVYRKMHLVPFGEYVPMKRVLFFAAPLVEAVSDFSPGETAVLLPVAGHQMSTAICYEIVYPDLVRRFVIGGSELLTTITNDAWFGRTSAPYQHFAQAAMRAIENGRYLVRAANTGISGIVDPYGRIVAESDLFQPAVMVGEVHFLNDSTFYTRYGDVFAYASAVLTLVMLLQSRVWPQSRI